MCTTFRANVLTLLLFEMFSGLCKHLFGRFGGINFHNQVQLFEVINDGHGLVHVGLEPLLEGLHVII
jgi:hypothetical protein